MRFTQDCSGKTALMFAAQYLNVELVGVLAEFEAGMRQKNGKTALATVRERPVETNEQKQAEIVKLLEDE